MMTRDKIQGMLLGGAIGDALGMPVETWTPEKIREIHPEGITKYESPIGHKWFTTDPEDPDPKKTHMRPGMTTDDTQLTIATMRALINAKTFSLEEQGKQHVAALKTSRAGWGKSTVEAIERLGNNVSWENSGKTKSAGRGTGNGVPMKCSPLAAYKLTFNGFIDEEFWKKVVAYSAMSHYTKMSAAAAVVHTFAVIFNLMTDPEVFDVDEWLDYVCNQSFSIFENCVGLDHLNKNDDIIEHELIFLYENRTEIKTWSLDQIRERFGNGSCYVFHSLPFTYALYIQNPHSFQTLLNTANAGGDTDTNAKLVGELMGSLHGLNFFKEPGSWVLDGLEEYHSLIQLAEEFCETFKVV